MALPIRLRLALVSAVLISAIVAALGAFVYVRLESDLRGSVDDGLAERAQALIDQAALGPELPTGASDIGDVFAAIYSRSGELLAATPELDLSALIDPTTIATLSGPRSFETVVASDEAPSVVRVLATPAPDGRVVVTGVAFDDQRDALAALATELALAVPVAVVFALLIGWLVGGAALRPVEQMRAEAEAISESELDRRLSVPPTRDELASLGRSLNRLLDRLQTAVERERRVVDAASHELRTPLANLKAELDLALRGSRTEAELAAALRSAADETDRLTRLAAELLVLARANDGHVPIRRASVDLATLFGDVAAAFGARASAAGLALEALAPSTPASLDPDRLRQAIDNVVDNALRRTPRGGRISMEAAIRDGWLEIAVADTGPGFPDGFIAQAFEPFSRTDAGRALGDGGAGLGLAIVRAIAEAHGGTASAANRPGGGALVTIRIPA